MVEDSTVSGVPLPHPDNPSRADIVRMRNALTVLDARQVVAGEAHGDLAAALDSETLQRQWAVAAETLARESAIADEQQARQDAIDDLQLQINEGLFDPSDYYDKPAVDAAMADKVQKAAFETLKSDVSMLALLALDVNGAGGVIDRWDYMIHDGAAAGSADVAFSVDNSSNGYSPINPLAVTGNGWTSNTSPAGYTLTMTPAPAVAGDEYKAMPGAAGSVVSGSGTTSTFEVVLPSPERVDTWTVVVTLGAARTGTLYFEGYRDGSWETIDTVAFTSTTNAGTFGIRTISPQSAATYERLRLRFSAMTATTFTYDSFNVTRFPQPVYVNQAYTVPGNPITFDIFAYLTKTPSISGSDFECHLSRDDGATWVSVPMAVVHAEGAVGYFKGSVTMAGPPGTQVRWRFRALAPAQPQFSINAVMLKWTI